MGFKDAEWAYALDLDLPGGAKSILVAICHRADDKTHETFVGRQKLAEMLGVSDRTVSSALVALENVGLIRRDERRRSGGYRDTDLLTVNREWEPPAGGSHVKEVQVKNLHVKNLQVKNLPISGEEFADLKGKNFKATRDKSLVVIQGSVIDHSPRARATFDDFWNAYPKKAKRPLAEARWNEATQTHDPDDILAGATRWRDEPFLVEQRWIPEPHNWLKDQRWNDDPPRRELTRNEQNLALVARLEAEEPKRHQFGEHLRVCETGHHKLVADGTCALCSRSALDIAAEARVAGL